MLYNFDGRCEVSKGKEKMVKEKGPEMSVLRATNLFMLHRCLKVALDHECRHETKPTSNAFWAILFNDFRQDIPPFEATSFLALRIKQLASRADILVNAPGTWAQEEQFVFGACRSHSEPFGASWHRCDAGREGELIFRSENPRDSYTSAASLYQNLWNRHVPTRRRIQNWLQLKKMPVERLEDVVTVLH